MPKTPYHLPTINMQTNKVATYQAIRIHQIINQI